MNQRRQLLGLLDSLKQLSRVEHQAVAEGEFSRLEQVQDEKKMIRQQIEELEPIPEGEISRHAAAEPVKQAVSEIMEMNRESNEQLLRRMGVLKAEAETQSQTRTTLRRVQGAYAKRLSPVHWEVST